MNATRTKEGIVPKPIANVFLDRGQSLVVRTGPGRQIQFLGGHVAIKDAGDLTPILRMPNATVVVDAEQTDWIDQWLKACGESPHEAPQAVIEMPDHTKRYPPDYAVEPEPDPVPARRGPGRPRRVEEELSLERIVEQGWNPS